MPHKEHFDKNLQVTNTLAYSAKEWIIREDDHIKHFWRKFTLTFCKLGRSESVNILFH